MQHLLTGKFSGARGACPVCGHDVERKHSFNGARLLDQYSCYRCGPTSYRVHALTGTVGVALS